MKKLIMASITAVVVIIVLAGTLIPILDDATATHETFVNEGSYFTVPDEGTHTIEVSTDSNGKVVIETDGEKCINPDTSLYGSATILYASRSFIRLDTSGGLRIVGSNGSSTYANTSIGNASDGITINISGTTATTTVNDTTYTITNVMYYIASDGDYTLSKNPYLGGDNTNLMGAGLTTFNGTSIGLVWYTTDGDNYTVTAVYPSGRTATLGEVTVETIDSYIDLSKLTSVTIDCADGTTPIGTATYNYVIAPAEVTVEKSVHFTDGENAIFGAIPVIVIVALLLAVVAMVIRSRMD